MLNFKLNSIFENLKNITDIIVFEQFHCKKIIK